MWLGRTPVCWLVSMCVWKVILLCVVGKWVYRCVTFSMVVFSGLVGCVMRKIVLVALIIRVW